jgi:hypothetical protein
MMKHFSILPIDDETLDMPPIAMDLSGRRMNDDLLMDEPAIA